jgi:hypothetical protein
MPREVFAVTLSGSATVDIEMVRVAAGERTASPRVIIAG